MIGIILISKAHKSTLQLYWLGSKAHWANITSLSHTVTLSFNCVISCDSDQYWQVSQKIQYRLGIRGW